MEQFVRPTLVTITGGTCSGKTFLRSQLELQENFGWERIVSTTTRPARAGEREGYDYYFIDEAESLKLEQQGLFAELVTYRGVRYGVTVNEMFNRFAHVNAATVVLEPEGVEMYKRVCRKLGLDIFKIYVTVPDELKLDRLRKRLGENIMADVDFDQAKAEYDSRKAAINGPERNWIVSNTWDAVVPGDDVEKAIGMIRLCVEWRNKRVSYGAN